MPRAKRLAWVFVIGVIAVLSVVAGPALVDVVVYRRMEGASWSDGVPSHGGEGNNFYVEQDTTLGGMLVYGRAKESRWTDGDIITPLLRFVWYKPDYRPAEYLVDIRIRDDLVCTTGFSESGEAIHQDVNLSLKLRAPNRHPIPYRPEEVRTLIHNAKLYVQQAAADGEIVLPDWWEAVE